MVPAASKTSSDSGASGRAKLCKFIASLVARRASVPQEQGWPFGVARRGDVYQAGGEGWGGRERRAGVEAEEEQQEPRGDERLGHRPSSLDTNDRCKATVLLYCTICTRSRRQARAGIYRLTNQWVQSLGSGLTEKRVVHELLST